MGRFTHVLLLLLLLPRLQLYDLVDVQYALPLVHFWRFTASDSSSEMVHSMLVNASTAYYVGLEAEDADGRWSGELHLMAVAQFQKQLAAFALCPGFEANSNKLQEPKELGFHCEMRSPNEDEIFVSGLTFLFALLDAEAGPSLCN